MDQAVFDELIMTAAEGPNAKNLDALLQFLRKIEGGTGAETAKQLNLLWENFAAGGMDAAKANFCLEIAALAIPGGIEFRAALSDAVKFLLPPYLGHPPFLRALGVRDDSTPPNEIVWRFRKLSALQSGTILFRADSWGVAGTPDPITGSLPVSPYGRPGSAAAVPIEAILREAALFSPGLEINQVTNPTRSAAMTSSAFRQAVRKRAVSSVSDTQLRHMALFSAGKKMNPEEFNAWWNTESAAPAMGLSAGGRRSCDGRSLAEIDLLLKKEAESKAGNFSAEEVAAFAVFFENLKAETAVRESKPLGKVIAGICARTAPGDRAALFGPLRHKAPFWPEDIAAASYATLAVWGELSAREIELLAIASAAVFDPEYLALSALKLPLKALNPVGAAIPDDILYGTLDSIRSCNADLLLWLWKNRKKHSPELLSLVSPENVLRALSQEGLPKAWGAAQRELRTTLLEKEDFQKQLILASGDNAASIATALQGALFLSPGERQSLVVKLTRHSEALKNHIESGAGRKILNAGLKSTDKKISVPTGNNLTFTSIRSHAKLLKELDDIINLHVPENREALKTARAHGDFRENAEFDAAKERRNYLSRRRSELERELTRIQPVSFRGKEAGDTAEIGCRVTLFDPEDGEETVYYLLGAWDGDPDRNYLSYLTRMGQCLLHQRVGDKIELPNGGIRVIREIASLPEAVLSEME